MLQWLSWLNSRFRSRHIYADTVWVVFRRTSFGGSTIIAVKDMEMDARSLSKPGDVIVRMRGDRYFKVEDPEKYEQRIYREFTGRYENSQGDK